MSLAEQIAQASRAEVEAPEGSGLWWRVRKVNSADLSKVKVAALRMVLPAAKADIAEDDDARVRAVTRIGDREIDSSARLAGGVVCAGVTHAREGTDGEWLEVRIVATEEDREKAGGLGANVLALTDLPAGVETALYAAIDRLHGDPKEAAERLARFRGGA